MNHLTQLKTFETQNRILYRSGLGLVLLVVVIWALLAANRPQLNAYLTDPGRDAKAVLARYETIIPETQQEKDLIEQNKILLGMNGIILKVLPLTLFLIGMFVFGLLLVGVAAYQQRILDFTRKALKINDQRLTNNEQRP